MGTTGVTYVILALRGYVTFMTIRMQLIFHYKDIRRVNVLAVIRLTKT